MKAWFPLLILVAGCASQPPPPVAFLYKGINQKVMLQIMGEPVQVLKTYQGEAPHLQEEKLYQFSNDKCVGGTKVVCTVTTTPDGVVFGWEGIKPIYTEDGQK